MFLGQGILGLAMLVLWAYCIFDVIRTDESTVQNLPKMIWLLIVIFVPTIGSLAWLVLGRPARASWELRGPQTIRPPQASEPATGLPERTPTSPADHQTRREEALRRHMAEREEELRRREQEVRRLEEELRRRESGETED